jgi:hypothetical protein
MDMRIWRRANAKMGVASRWQWNGDSCDWCSASAPRDSATSFPQLFYLSWPNSGFQSRWSSAGLGRPLVSLRLSRRCSQPSGRSESSTVAFGLSATCRASRLLAHYWEHHDRGAPDRRYVYNRRAGEQARSATVSGRDEAAGLMAARFNQCSSMQADPLISCFALTVQRY